MARFFSPYAEGSLSSGCTLERLLGEASSTSASSAGVYRLVHCSSSRWTFTPMRPNDQAYDLGLATPIDGEFLVGDSC
jgi:hypothetical protein